MTDPHTLAARQAAAEQRFLMRASMAAARGVDPDAHARAMRLGPHLGTTAAGATLALEQDPQADALAGVDLDELSRRSPLFAQWLTDPDAAKVSSDDVLRLSRVERAVAHVRPAESVLGGLANAGEAGLVGLGVGTHHISAMYGISDIDEAAARVAELHIRRLELDAARPAEVVRAERRISPLLADVDDAWEAYAQAITPDPDAPPLENLFGFQEPPPLANRELAQLSAGVGRVFGRATTTPAGVRYLGETSVQSFAQSSPSIALGTLGGIGGAAVGAPSAGAAGGTFVGSVFVEIGAWIDQEIAERGIDMTDPAALAELYRDAEFTERVKREAERKGVTTALLDSAFAVVGGGATARAGRAATGGVVRRAARRVGTAAVEVVGQGLGEAGAEAGGQIAATGSLQPSEVLMEALASGPTSVAEVTSGVARRRVADALQHRATAEEAAQAVQQLGDALDESAAAKRAPELVGQLAQAAADRAGIDRTPIPLDDWNAHWRGSDRAPVDVVRDLVGDERPYHAARTTGTVDLPTSAFVRLEKADRDALLPFAEIQPTGSSEHTEAVLAELSELITAADDEAVQQEALAALEQELEGIEDELADLDRDGLAQTGVVLEQPPAPEPPSERAEDGQAAIDALAAEVAPEAREEVAQALRDAALALDPSDPEAFDAVVGALEERLGIPAGVLRAALPEVETVAALAEQLAGSEVPFAPAEAGPAESPAPAPEAAPADGTQATEVDTAARRVELMARAAEIRAQLDEADAARPPAPSEVAAAERDRLATELRAAGRPQTEAVIGASLYTRAMETLAERHGLDLEELFDRFELSARRGDRGQEGAAVAQEGDEAPRAALRMSGAGRSRAFDLEFYAGADESSLYHELGHYFLEVLGDLAADDGAPAGLRDQFAAALAHLGVESRADITAEHHETWARSFEAYLREGRAPSLELRALFATFRAWLTRIYRDLRGLDVELTDEARTVFDRLLASDEEIAAAREDEQARALFGSAEEAGMSPAEWRDYQEAQQAALDDASQALDEKLLRAVSREARAQHRRRLEEIRAEVTTQVDRSPGELARAWLADGTRPDGSPLPEGLEPTKLDRAQVEAARAEPVVRALDRLGVLSAPGEVGAPLDVAALAVGLDRPEQLVEALLTVLDKPKLIEAQARAQLAAEHPDLVAFGGRRRAAARGAVLDARNRVLRAEATALRRLARAEGRRADSAQRTAQRDDAAARRQALGDVPHQADVRRAARRALQAVPLGELQPTRRRLAARREARRAADRVRVGAYGQASESVRRQLYNLELGSVGQQMLEDSQKHLRAIRRAVKPRALATIGRTDPMRRDAIRDIAAALGLDQGANPPEARADRLRAMAAELEAEGRVLPLVASNGNGGIPDWLFADPRPVRELTAQQIEEAGQVVQALQHHARRDRELLREREGIEFAQRIREAVASIVASRPERKDARRLGPQSPDLQAVEGLTRDGASLRKLSFIAREMDQDQDIGPVYAVLVRALNEAAPDESLRVADLAPRFTRLMELLTPQEQREMASREFAIPGLYDDRGQPMSLTLEVMLSVALNWGNAGNRQRVMGMVDAPTRGHFTRDQVERLILPQLTERHWDFVEAAWQLVGSFRDEIVEHHQRIHGLQLKTVPAESFTVLPADGTGPREVSGGYFPIRFSDVQQANQDAAKMYDEVKRGFDIASITAHGHTNERVAETHRPVAFELSVISRHLFNVIHDLTHREAVLDVNRVLRDKTLQTAIEDHYGRGTREQLQGVVQAVATNGRRDTGPFEGIARHMRHATTMSVLGYRVSTAIMQFTGLIPAMTRTGAAPMWRAVRYLFFEGRMTERFKEMAQASPLLATRDTSHDRDVRELMEHSQFSTSLINYYKNQAARAVTGGRASFRDVAATSMWMTANAQKLVDRVVWQAAALKAAEDGVTDPVSIREIADQAVIDTQGSGFIKDLSAVQRHNEFFRWLTLFYSWGNTQLNLNVNAWRAWRSGRGSAAKFLSDILLINIIPTLMATLIMRALSPRDDDDDPLEQILKDQAAAVTSMFPGIREFSGSIQGFNRYQGPAGMRPLVNLIQLYNQIAQGEADDGLLDASIDVLSTTFGIPTGQFEKTLDGAHALLSGETSNPGALIMGGPR